MISRAPAPLSGPRHRRLALLATLALTAGLTACTTAEPLAAASAVSHYDGAAATLTAALAPNGAPWTLQESSRKVASDGGTCTYSPGIWNASPATWNVRSEDDWDPVIDALRAPARAQGFTEISGPHRMGALTYIEATDEHGARLRLDSQGSLSIRQARVDAAPCTPAALGLES